MKINGFTLIELVVVIVILGILAATAVPKFVNFEAEAKTATLQAIKASMEGASALVYGKSLVKGNHKEKFTFSNIPTIDIEDGPLVVNFGYPLAQLTSLNRLIDIDFDRYKTKKTTDGSTLMFYFSSEPDDSVINTASNCIVYYIQPSKEGDKPKIVVNNCE